MGIQPVTTIQNQVYRALKREICSGGFQPDQKLQEQDLAAQFQVSRSPIREALRKLASDGLVEEIPNRGVFVRRFTIQDIEEIYEVRVMMESQAISSMKMDAVMANEGALTDILYRMQTHCHDLSAYTDLDTELHRLLVQMCGNRLMFDLYDRVDCRIQQFRRISLLDANRLNDSVDEHQQIIRFLFQGNLEAARRMNQQHLLLARDQIILYMKNAK